MYLHARYYDSALGVFLSPDPISADLNTYRYSVNDPVNFSDPSGLSPGDTTYCEWNWTDSNGDGQIQGGELKPVMCQPGEGGGGGGRGGGPPGLPPGGGLPGPAPGAPSPWPIPGPQPPFPGPGPTTPPPTPGTPGTPEIPLVPEQPNGTPGSGSDAPAENPFDRSRPDRIPQEASRNPFGPPCEGFSNRFSSNFNTVSVPFVPITSFMSAGVFALHSTRLSILGQVGAASLNLSIAASQAATGAVVSGGVLFYHAGAAFGSAINAAHHYRTCRP